MSRDQKLSLIIGFAVLLVVGMLWSEYVSSQERASPEEMEPPMALMAFPDRPVLPMPEPEPHRPPEPVAEDSYVGGTIEEMFEPEEPVVRRPFVFDNSDGILVHDGQERAREPIPQPQPEPAEAEPRGVWYVVKKNDTLYKICKTRYGDGEMWRKVARLNEGRVGQKDGSVREGVKIFLPDSPDRSRPTPERERGEPPVGTSPAVVVRTYTVRSNDCLGIIAQRELGTLRRQGEILALNGDKIADPNDIRVGMVLKLPVQ